MKHAARTLGVLALVLWLGRIWWPSAVSAAEGQMTWAIHVTLAPRWLDPAETESSITPFMVLYPLHDAIAKPMASGFSTPSLAEPWSLTPDGLTYEFVLRSGTKFHNGQPFPPN